MQHFPTHDKLHTDVLEAKYGPIRAKILRQSVLHRSVELIDNKGICRTYAFSIRTRERIPAAVDHKIRCGAAIGKAFRESKYVVRKNVLAVFITTLPAWLQTNMHVKERKAKVRISEFLARRGNQKAIVYATVIEVYSPDFRTPQVNAVDRSQLQIRVRSQEKRGMDRATIWEKLDEKSAGKASSQDQLTLNHIKFMRTALLTAFRQQKG